VVLKKEMFFESFLTIKLNLVVLFVPRLGKTSVTLPIPNKNEKFHALPEPTGTAPYPFDKVIPRKQIKRIDKSGSIQPSIWLVIQAEQKVHGSTHS
jgi:hypothetical protein